MTRLFLLLMICSLRMVAADFYVATNGGASATGTIGDPATPTRAIALVAAETHPVTTNHNVYFLPGFYYFTNHLTYRAADSGTETHPIVYSAYTNGLVRLSGGPLITNWISLTNAAISNRLSIAARTNVYQASLTNYPALLSAGVYGSGTTNYWINQNELIFNGVPQTVARFPNGTNLYCGTVTSSNTFVVTNAQPYTWLPYANIMAQGYFAFDYNNLATFVTNFDVGNQRVTLVGALGGNAPIAGHRFFFLNVLEELDSAGEYYFDRTNSTVYFWPPSSITNAETIVSYTSNLFNIALSSNLVFSGLTMEATTLYPVVVQTSRGINFTNCVFRNSAGDGVYISETTNATISNCTITNIGQRAVEILFGGDRATKRSAGGIITNSTIQNFARLDYTVPGILLKDIGYTVSHNDIFNSPHSAIYFPGNDNVIEYNDIWNVCMGSADSGAVYSGNDWSFGGCIFRYNRIHDIHVADDALNPAGVIGLYMDDCLTGVQVYGNSFDNLDNGIHLGGGRNNTISNNLFIDCLTSSVQTDQRLTSWWPEGVTALSNKLVAMPYQTAPWSNSYPHLLTLLSDSPSNALYNVITNNVRYQGTWLTWQDNAQSVVSTNNNWITGDPGFVDYDNGNYHLTVSAPALALPFTDIPFEEIGRQEAESGRVTLNIGVISFSP